jgi:type IV pilus biogenesis protein CpaD/CtpE
MPRFDRAVTARVLAALLTAALAGVAKGAPMTTAALPAPYLSRQAPAEFRAGKAVGVTTDPALRLAPDAPVSGGVTTGTLESAVLSAAAPFTELLPSWNAVTPAGTWVTLEVRADLGGAGRGTTRSERGPARTLRACRADPAWTVRMTPTRRS